MKRGCGKLLNIGDKAVSRQGLYLCLDCDKKYPTRLMVVYSEGILKQAIKCGEVAR